MIIDFHAHIFPQKIAAKAVASTGSYYGLDMHKAGTPEDLVEQMRLAGVDRTLVHSTATKPEQVIAVNNFIAESCKKYPQFIGFGTLHPAMEDLEAEFDRILSMGLHGIKLHADFQNFRLDDPDVLYMYDVIRGRLPLLLHMGDINTDKTTPARLANVLRQFPGLTVIAAHFGGYSVWDEARELLGGSGIYVDTSSSLPFMTPKYAAELVHTFGEDKCLFGTDYPMWDAAEELERLGRLELGQTATEMILSLNARELLGI